jgi:hypothetical protein
MSQSMLREHLAKKRFGEKNGFRWRGAGEIARIEGFTDAVFAFAVTLLVVSLETQSSVQSHLINAGVGVLSVLIVVIGGPHYGFWSGISYGLIGPLQTLNGWKMGARIRKLEAVNNS